MQQRLAKKLKQQTLPDATVLQDDDVYAAHGGVQSKPIGVLRAPNKVSLIEARPDQWCHVQGNAMPHRERLGLVCAGLPSALKS